MATTEFGVQQLKELFIEKAGDGAYVEIVKADTDRRHVEVACSYVGRLIGKGSSTLAELQQKSGWTIRVCPWGMNRQDLEKELESVASFRRFAPLQEGPDKFVAKAYFAEKPDRKVLTAMRTRTGWQIEPEEEGELSAEEACRIVAEEHPQASVTCYQETPGTKKVNVYATNIGELIGPGGREAKRLVRMTGRKLDFKEVDKAPPGATQLYSEPAVRSQQEDAIVDVEITKPRCRVCLGQKQIRRPVVGLHGITWTPASCPLCSSADDNQS